MAKKAEFRCGLNGIVPKQSPDLLTDGQYRSAVNIVSNQEGSVSSRGGIKQIGQADPSLPTCYFARKLVLTKGEDPMTPGSFPGQSGATPNLRYLGMITSSGDRNIYRSTNYSLSTLVASDVDSNQARHWEMADYAAGEVGAAWAYFACPNAMLKDRGSNPYPSLVKWGIQPATGVVLCAAVRHSVSIQTIAWGYANAWAGVVITLSAPGGITDFDRLTISGVPAGITITTTDGRTDINSTWDIRAGLPDGNGNIINADTMFRIFDTNGQMVTASGSYAGGGSVTNVPAVGNLDGGAGSSPNNTQPYDWVLVYEETDTGDKGNPSQFMSPTGTASITDNGTVYTTNPLAIHNGIASLAVWGTNDPRIGFIRIYRRGGSLVDGIGRLVARVANPGAEQYVIFQDNTADADLVYAEQWETDNNPPVTSSVASPIRSTLSAPVGTGWQTANLAANVFSPVTPGTLVHIVDPAGSEDVYVESATDHSFRAFFQLPHASGVTVEVDAITGQACNLVIEFDESLIVAGDPNNPHIAYKSKRGQPQAFPVGTDAAGAITSIGVGTPSNGIVNMTPCRGQILFMNVSALYEVAVIQGSFMQPARVSEKGLVGQSAWCKTDSGEIWYLSDDGVYSWNGAISQKRTGAIDPIFHDKEFNGIAPIDRTPSVLSGARMEYRRGTVYLAYTDIGGHSREIACEPAYGDRWYLVNHGITGSAETPVTMLFCEPDTRSLIVSLSGQATGQGSLFGIADTYSVIGGSNYASDWWTSSSMTGNPISWSLLFPWFDMGDPSGQKLFEEVWLDIDPQLYQGVYSHDSSITVSLLLDYSDTPVDSFTISIPSGSSLNGRRLVSLLPNLTGSSGNYQSYGRQARAISFLVSGTAFPAPFSLFRILIQYEEMAGLTAGAPSGWMDLGSKHDKRLYQMCVVFDTAGKDRQIILESRGGRDGKTDGTPQVFTLSSPTDLGSSKAMKVFPLADPTIGKLFRVRPYSSAAVSGGNSLSSIDLFQIMEVSFPDAEEYPPDIVSVTPWEDGGYEYDKYANQLDLEVNTNGVPVVMRVQADGVTVGPPFTVTATESDRRRNITLPPGLIGKKWRIYVDPSQSALTTGNGLWQLFSHAFKFQPADKGEVAHTGDWDDLGYPWDKLLLNVTIEYDTSNGGPVILQMDTLSGISGTVFTANVAQFPLGTGRGKTTFPIPADTIVKMVRVYPSGPVPSGYKQWKYQFDQVNYPADFVRVTPWKDANSPTDKDPSWLWIDADTLGVPATVQLQHEQGTALTVQHGGTVSNRKKNYPLPPDTHAKMWRLVPMEGIGGRFQLFDWGFDRWQPFPLSSPIDPPEIILCTPWTDAGYPFGKIGRSVSLIINTGGVPCGVTLQSSEGAVIALPAVTSTYTDRQVVLTVPQSPQGTLWRLLFSPGTGGLSQLWNWIFDGIRMPPALTRWSSSWQGFGYKGWKFIKQVWIDYICQGTVSMILTSDTGSFTVGFPASPSRSAQRALLPAVWGSGLNKSKLYSIDIVSDDPSKPFQIFADVSGIEWIPCGSDRHTAYMQTPLSSFMEVAT
jgi:hypothetical protein